MSTPGGGPGGAPPGPDLLERGANGQTSTRRLYLQLQVFTRCSDAEGLAAELARSPIEAVLYADVNDPAGVGILALSEDPTVFISAWRELLAAEMLGRLVRRPELTMFGRTYASGFEPELEDWLLQRPRRTVLNPGWPWAVWYPLRRVGGFARLSGPEQSAVLREHAVLGRSYGDADLAHDIRLACHGLDTHDNDFVIGLVGRELH